MIITYDALKKRNVPILNFVPVDGGTQGTTWEPGEYRGARAGMKNNIFYFSNML